MSSFEKASRQSAQSWNFSTNHASSPTGESPSAEPQRLRPRPLLLQVAALVGFEVRPDPERLPLELRVKDTLQLPPQKGQRRRRQRGRGDGEHVEVLRGDAPWVLDGNGAGDEGAEESVSTTAEDLNRDENQISV